MPGGGYCGRRVRRRGSVWISFLPNEVLHRTPEYAHARPTRLGADQTAPIGRCAPSAGGVNLTPTGFVVTLFWPGRPVHLQGSISTCQFCCVRFCTSAQRSGRLCWPRTASCARQRAATCYCARHANANFHHPRRPAPVALWPDRVTSNAAPALRIHRITTPVAPRSSTPTRWTA